MKDTDNWGVTLDGNYSLLIIVLVIFFFAGYGFLLCAPLLSNMYSDLSAKYLEEARSCVGGISAAKALLYKNALKTLKAAIKFNYPDAQLYYRYARIAREIADDSPVREVIDIDGTGAMAHGREGFYGLASRYCKRAIFKEPANAAYHMELGIIYDNLSGVSHADREFKRALLLDPENVDMRISLLRYFLSRGEEREFLDYLNETYALCAKGGENSVLCRLMLESFLREVKREGLIRNDPALPRGGDSSPEGLGMKGRAG